MVADGVCGIRTCAWLILYSHLSGARVQIGQIFQSKKSLNFIWLSHFQKVYLFDADAISNNIFLNSFIHLEKLFWIPKVKFFLLDLPLKRASPSSLLVHGSTEWWNGVWIDMLVF